MDYLQKDRIVNVQCKANLLKHLEDNIKQKRPRISTKEVLFHQDNVRAHMLVVMMATIRDRGLQIVSHPPNSPGMAPPTLTRAGPVGAVLRPPQVFRR